MYRISVTNFDDSDSKDVIIHDMGANEKIPKIKGTVKIGINVIDSFTFTIYFDNPGYNLIKPYRSLIKIYNIKTDKYEFIGRPITPSKQMEESGIFYKSYVCESVKGFLYDSMQEYGEYHNISPTSYFDMLINRHNKTVDNYKRFKIGAVTVKDSNDSLYRYTAYESTYKNINDDLTNPLDGELIVRYGNGNAPWTIDLLSDYGDKSTTKIKMGINMAAISEKVDFGNFATRIIPLGSKLKTTASDGSEKETEERLTVESVNGGKNYIDIPDLINEYGIIEKIVTFDNVTVASNLLKKGKQYAESMILLISNTISAYDLGLLGYDYDTFEVGNYYGIEHAGLDIDYDARLIEKQIVIHDPKSNTLTFGDHGADFKTYLKLTTESLSKLVTAVEDDLKKIPAEVLKQAKINATELIKMCSEGNVVMHLNEKMKPYEILIMDTDDIDTAKRVWRWNVQGLGYSKTGYNGEYGLAITMDGSIVADYITAGTLRGVEIYNGDGSFHVTADGFTTIKKGKIGAWNISEDLNYVGSLHADNLLNDGYLYRVWNNRAQNYDYGEDPTWIYSIQKGSTQGPNPSAFIPIFVVKQNGTVATSGDVYVEKNVTVKGNVCADKLYLSNGADELVAGTTAQIDLSKPTTLYVNRGLITTYAQ